MRTTHTYNKKLYPYNIDVEKLLKLQGKFHVYWKDKEGFYLGCNELSAEKAGLRSRDEIIGTSDYDIPYDVAEIAIRQDDEVVTAQTTKYFTNTATYTNHTVIDYFTVKSPLRNLDNEIVGTLGISYYISEGDFPENKKSDLYNQISAAGIAITEATPGKKNNMSGIIYKNDKNTLLSRRQAECLFHLIYGKTSKQIAKEMNISYRTVEKYIEILKYKMQCHDKSALISEALKIESFKKSLIHGKLIF